MTQEPSVKVQMDSGETPLQHQSLRYKNQEIAEVFTSKPERPQGSFFVYLLPKSFFRNTKKGYKIDVH